MPDPDEPRPAEGLEPPREASALAYHDPRLAGALAESTASPEPEPDRAPPKRARWFLYTDASSLGIEIAVAITFGAVAGYYIERYLTHWSPWTMLLGFAFGVVVAVKAVVRTARAYQASLRRDAAEAAKQAEAQAKAPTEPSVPVLSTDAPRGRHRRHPSDELARSDRAPR